MNRRQEIAALVLLTLSLLAVGCSTPAPVPAKPASQTAPTQSDAPPPPSFVKSDQNLPVSEGMIRQAVAAPSPVGYQVTVVSDRQGRSQEDWLKEASGPKVDAKAMVIVVFKEKGYPLLFALGDYFAQKSITDQAMREMVATHYAPSAQAGDPSTGVARLVEAVNKRLAAAK